jgi:hypothetical protein
MVHMAFRDSVQRAVHSGFRRSETFLFSSAHRDGVLIASAGMGFSVHFEDKLYYIMLSTGLAMSQVLLAVQYGIATACVHQKLSQSQRSMLLPILTMTATAFTVSISWIPQSCYHVLIPITSYVFLPETERVDRFGNLVADYCGNVAVFVLFVCS